MATGSSRLSTITTIVVGVLCLTTLLIGCEDSSGGLTPGELTDMEGDAGVNDAMSGNHDSDTGATCDPFPLPAEVSRGHQTTVAAETTEPPTIDGSLDEAFYAETPALEVSGAGSSDNETTARILWNTENLFVVIEVSDGSVETDGDAWISSRDGVEIMLDVDNQRGTRTSGDHHWIIDAAGESLTELYTETDEEPPTDLGERVAAAPTNDGYAIEIEVPLSALELSPEDGTRVGLLLVTNDRDDGDAQNFTWPESAEWKNPSSWGEVYFASACEGATGGDMGANNGVTSDAGDMAGDMSDTGIDPGLEACEDGGDFELLPEAGPAVIGGGPAYDQKVCRADADVVVQTRTELEDALANAASGDVIFIDPDAEIDMGFDARLTVPAGVTLSGGRGCNCRAGALLYTDDIVKVDYDNEKILLAADDSRVTGLRVRGPWPREDWVVVSEQDHYIDGRGIDATGADVEVDNNEIWGFGEGGVGGAARTHVHHNNIQSIVREGLGYGVNGGDDLLIEYNYFNWVRHAIASGGRRSYEARYNYMGSHAISHVFDMHKEGGETILIHHNTFEPVENDIKNKNIPAVGIRGVPSDEAHIHHNWIYNPKPPCTSNEGESWADCAIHQRWVDDFTNVTFNDNHYASTDPGDCAIGAPRDGCPLP